MYILNRQAYSSSPAQPIPPSRPSAAARQLGPTRDSLASQSLCMPLPAPHCPCASEGFENIGIIALAWEQKETKIKHFLTVHSDADRRLGT